MSGLGCFCGMYRRVGVHADGCPALETAERDGRDPDPTRDGIFRDHNCWKCRSGELPCATQKPGREYLCEYPYARND